MRHPDSDELRKEPAGVGVLVGEEPPEPAREEPAWSEEREVF